MFGGNGGFSRRYGKLAGTSQVHFMKDRGGGDFKGDWRKLSSLCIGKRSSFSRSKG